MNRLKAWGQKWLQALESRLAVMEGGRSRQGVAGRVVVVLLVGFLAWAALAPLSKGVVAPGTVVVDSKRKTLQHLEGGTIKAIHVKEGDRVMVDQVLVELDETKTRAERDVVRSRYWSRLASRDRLRAQMEGKSTLVFSEPLLTQAHHPEVVDLMQVQQNVFKVLVLEYLGKRGIARQRTGQMEHKLQGLEAYLKTTQQQIRLLEGETHRLQGLHEKRLVESSVVAERLQQLSQQQGEQGKTVASMAEARIAISEAQLADLQVVREYQQDLVKQLTEVEESLVELKSQLDAAQNVLDRTVIKAPIAGVVLGLKVSTIGGVLTTGTPIMDVVPEGDALVIDAHVRPLDVDSVHKGMQIFVKFTSFKSKMTPDLVGVVDTLSADVLADPNKGEPYYLMRVTVPAAELKKLQGQAIIPGMPAEVFANAGSRTLLQYLLDPLTGVLRKSMRED